MATRALTRTTFGQTVAGDGTRGLDVGDLRAKVAAANARSARVGSA